MDDRMPEGRDGTAGCNCVRRKFSRNPEISTTCRLWPSETVSFVRERVESYGVLSSLTSARALEVA